MCRKQTVESQTSTRHSSFRFSPPTNGKLQSDALSFSLFLSHGFPLTYFSRERKQEISRENHTCRENGPDVLKNRALNSPAPEDDEVDPWRVLETPHTISISSRRWKRNRVLLESPRRPIRPPRWRWSSGKISSRSLLGSWASPVPSKKLRRGSRSLIGSSSRSFRYDFDGDVEIECSFLLGSAPSFEWSVLLSWRYDL